MLGKRNFYNNILEASIIYSFVEQIPYSGPCLKYYRFGEMNGPCFQSVCNLTEGDSYINNDWELTSAFATHL